MKRSPNLGPPNSRMHTSEAFSIFRKVESARLFNTMLQPLDVVICMKLVSCNREFPGYEYLATELSIGISSAHRSVRRLQLAGLMTSALSPIRSALLELLVYGVRYVYFVKPGEPTRGIPTAHSAPPLSKLIGGDSDVPVWPHPTGKVRGFAVKPLHKSVPEAALKDPKLYELFALVDTMRIGRVRERELAREELRKRLLP